MYGERSQVVKAPDCGSGIRGFKSHRSPLNIQLITQNCNESLLILDWVLVSIGLLMVLSISLIVPRGRSYHEIITNR